LELCFARKQAYHFPKPKNRKETYLMKTNQLGPMACPAWRETPLAEGKPHAPRKPAYLWQYLVDDLLEIGCSLREDQRRFLIDELSLEEETADSVDIYPSFLLGKKLVVVMNLIGVEGCWLYDASQKRIEKYPFKRAR